MVGPEKVRAPRAYHMRGSFTTGSPWQSRTAARPCDLAAEPSHSVPAETAHRWAVEAVVPMAGGVPRKQAMVGLRCASEAEIGWSIFRYRILSRLLAVARIVVLIRSQNGGRVRPAPPSLFVVSKNLACVGSRAIFFAILYRAGTDGRIEIGSAHCLHVFSWFK
jgi:hypothetical protein